MDRHDPRLLRAAAARARARRRARPGVRACSTRADAARLAHDAFDGALEDFVRARRASASTWPPSYTPDKLRRWCAHRTRARRSQGSTRAGAARSAGAARGGAASAGARARAGGGAAELGAEEAKPMVLRALGKLEACAARWRAPGGRARRAGRVRRLRRQAGQRGAPSAAGARALPRCAGRAWIVCARRTARRRLVLLAVKRLLEHYSAPLRGRQARALRPRLRGPRADARDLLAADPAGVQRCGASASCT